MQFLIYYNNDKYFLVLVIYISFLCFIPYFFKKALNNKLITASWPKFCNVSFFVFAKRRSVLLVDQQINLVLP